MWKEFLDRLWYGGASYRLKRRQLQFVDDNPRKDIMDLLWILSAEPDVQIMSYPDDSSKLLYDRFDLVTDTVNHDQLLYEEFGTSFEEMTKCLDQIAVGSRWTEDALRIDPLWSNIRILARSQLKTSRLE